jgi:hypothetical protein
MMAGPLGRGLPRHDPGGVGRAAGEAVGVDGQRRDRARRDRARRDRARVVLSAHRGRPRGQIAADLWGAGVDGAAWVNACCEGGAAADPRLAAGGAAFG